MQVSASGKRKHTSLNIIAVQEKELAGQPEQTLLQLMNSDVFS